MRGGVGAYGGREALLFDHETDVVVVGTGAAGAIAALYAHERGAQVLVLEKAPVFGGTTAKSGGVYWIPNHPIERERGLKEPRETTLAGDVPRVVSAAVRSADKPRFGLPQHEYELIETFYDRGADAVVGLEKMGALASMPADVLVGPDARLHRAAEREEDRRPALLAAQARRIVRPRRRDDAPAQGGARRDARCRC